MPTYGYSISKNGMAPFVTYDRRRADEFKAAGYDVVRFEVFAG